LLVLHLSTEDTLSAAEVLFYLSPWCCLLKKVNKWLLLLATLFESEFEQTQRIRLLSGRGFGVTE
jgi:hypothetical protein